MRIAIASGKGGTGKTTFATNFAHALAQDGVSVAYLDCDVEEPNGHIFLPPKIEACTEVSIPVPEVDLSKCTYCGQCGQACRFSAIITVKQRLLTFPKLCHGCGACVLACPEQAIRQQGRRTGTVERGTAGGVFFAQGRLDIGCPVIASVTGADFVLLVTEPTLSAIHDLKRVATLCRHFGVTAGICINKFDLNPELSEALIGESVSLGLDVLEKIPYDPNVTRAQVAHQSVVELEDGPAAQRIRRLWRRIQETMAATQQKH